MSAHSEVTVYVRIRPTARFDQELVDILPDKQTVVVRQRKKSRKEIILHNQVSSWSFRFNGVLHNVSQEEVYQQVTHSVVIGALEGYNGTVMCYGQTGAGKTFTMTGATECYQKRGIIPRAIQEVFHEIDSRIDHTFSVHLSYLEIYNETLVDLLALVKGGQRKHCATLAVVDEPDGRVSVKGLSLHSVNTEEAALNLLFEEGDEQEHSESSRLLEDSPSAKSFYNAYNRTVLRRVGHGPVSRMNSRGLKTNTLQP